MLVCTAVALAVADGSIVTLALPDMLSRFEVEIPDVAWVLVSYNLVLALAVLPAARLARSRPRAVFAGGALGFAAASAACALAPSFAVLLASRCVQAVAGAAVVCAALDLLSARLADGRAVRAWTRAGIAGAAFGPGVGGVLTQVAGWESIFWLQVPFAAVVVAAVAHGGGQTPGHVLSRRRDRVRVGANAALLLVSAALSAALFLLVLLLVNGWRVDPAVAGVVVTVMPLAAVAAGGLAGRVGGRAVRAATGAVAVAGGLAALSVLPAASATLTLAPQLLVGSGLGLALSALTEEAVAARSPQVVHAAWSIASRHGGVVLGLLLLTPLFTAALDRNEREALTAGAAVVLDSRVPPLEKIRLAQDVLAEVDRAEGEIPDVSPAFAARIEGEDGRLYAELQERIEGQLDRAVTNAFSSPFLVAAVLAALALAPVAAWRLER